MIQYLQTLKHIPAFTDQSLCVFQLPAARLVEKSWEPFLVDTECVLNNNSGSTQSFVVLSLTGSSDAVITDGGQENFGAAIALITNEESWSLWVEVFLKLHTKI